MFCDVTQLQAFYYEGKSIMSNEEFDNLKEELMWEGSSVVMLSNNCFILHFPIFAGLWIFCNDFLITLTSFVFNSGADEQRFLEASMAYVSGNPILSDEEYDKLKTQLKVY